MIIEVARKLDIQGICVAGVSLTFCIARGASCTDNIFGTSTETDSDPL